MRRRASVALHSCCLLHFQRMTQGSGKRDYIATICVVIHNNIRAVCILWNFANKYACNRSICPLLTFDNLQLNDYGISFFFFVHTESHMLSSRGAKLS